jgi:hypothetical protein
MTFEGVYDVMQAERGQHVWLFIIALDREGKLCSWRLLVQRLNIFA